MLVISVKSDSPYASLNLSKNNRKLDQLNWESQGNLADSIHANIKKLLDDNHESLNNLGGIVVFRGPGSFTGLRIGLSVANALAYGLDIPIVGTQGPDWETEGLRLLAKKIDHKIVLPEYGGDVKTTPPKK